MQEMIWNDAKRTAQIATFILAVGWASVIVVVIYFFVYWFQLADTGVVIGVSGGTVAATDIGFIEALLIALNVAFAPFFLSLVVAGVGHGLRLFALSKVAGPGA